MTKATKVTTVEQGKGLTYVGDGAYIVGVPARDLSAEEAALYAPIIDASTKSMGRSLYLPVDAGLNVEEN